MRSEEPSCSFEETDFIQRKLEVKPLRFVTADSCRMQLERLTQLLVSAFPGSTIYQHTDLFRVTHDVLNNKVDAVFLEAEMDQANGLDFIKMLRRQKPEVPVFIISKTRDLCEEAKEAGASGCFILPGCEQQLLDAIRLTKTKENVS